MIKQKPEDFIVKEIMDLELNKGGDYVYFLLRKRNLNTMDAIEKIANKLRIETKRLGFAGLKDKKALTEQYVSIKGISRRDLKRLKLEGIEIEIVGEGDEKIKLGSLIGNEFKIKVYGKNYDKEISWIINYFGEQRFGTNTYNFGRDVLKGKIPRRERRLLILYIHAVQSLIFNKTIENYLGAKYVKEKPENIKIPLIGYETLIDDKLKEIVYDLMKREELSFSDFLIKGHPELSMKGAERDMIVEVESFKCENNGDDCTLSFKLPKGSYATEVIEYLEKS